VKLDTDYVRSQFPQLQNDDDFVFCGNAGGSYVAQPVLDIFAHYNSHLRVQPYYQYPSSTAAGLAMDKARSGWCRALNIDHEELTIGPSTSMNSYVMARMKVWTQGKALWSRTIGSTVVGQGVDSLIVYPLAFWGIWEPSVVITVMVTNWLLKVLWEAVLTPVTYVVIGWLKRHEGVDVYDEDTNFTPFSTST